MTTPILRAFPAVDGATEAGAEASPDAGAVDGAWLADGLAVAPGPQAATRMASPLNLLQVESHPQRPENQHEVRSGLEELLVPQDELSVASYRPEYGRARFSLRSVVPIRTEGDRRRIGPFAGRRACDCGDAYWRSCRMQP